MRPSEPVSPVAIGTRHHSGIHYHAFLKRLHDVVRPETYLEIGVYEGDTLALAECTAIAVDVSFRDLKHKALDCRPVTHLFQMTSDLFFKTQKLSILIPTGIDLAFLDGMHQFEFLLRDIINIERSCHLDSVIALHDCCPVNLEMAERKYRPDARLDKATCDWWTGDVWKLLPILRHHRPEITLTVLDCPPTGLVLLTGLDPNSTVLRTEYDDIIASFAELTLNDYGYDRLRAEFPASDSRSVYEQRQLAGLICRS